MDPTDTLVDEVMKRNDVGEMERLLAVGMNPDLERLLTWGLVNRPTNVKMIETIVSSKGYKPDQARDGHFTALQRAMCVHENMPMAAVLLKSGSDIHQRIGPNGPTMYRYLLHTRPRRPKSLQFLSDHKANPNMKDRFGVRDFLYAIGKGDHGVVRQMLAAGADLDSVGPSGSPLSSVDRCGNGRLDR